VEDSIRKELLAYMVKNQMLHSHFAEIAGINAGTLSRLLKGEHPISMAQLVAITAGMRLPEDHFFEDYIEECFSFSVSMRRIRPFLLRCAELERLDCVQQIVDHVLEELSYVPVLFEMAEELYITNRLLAARILYRGVSEAEKFQHSERLALCQYRMFLIDLEQQEDLEENLRAATRFELYVNRLDEADQLDALKQLMHVFGMVHKWSKVDALAEEMCRIASIQYDLAWRQAERMVTGQKPPERPIYYYILYAYLARAKASEECRDYKRALSFVELYGNGNKWVHEKDKQSEQILAQFSEWAVANTYLYRVLSGDVDVIDAYADYIASQEDEIFIAVRQIVHAANLYGVNVDHILERFKAYIPYQSENLAYGEYKPAILKESYAQFLSDLAIYRFNQNKDTTLALNLVLQGLESSIAINSSKNIISLTSRLLLSLMKQQNSDIK
jgi:transcriptional regulator with XRE-family HTH domain